jgi:PqqD family protein of HPr-rel-A system
LAALANELLWVEADGEFVLFHRPSGKTHFVNHATFLLLDQVLREPKDLTKTASHLAQAQGAAATGDFQQQLAELLQRLEELGLVERT